ncbi:invasion associated locus B family protein [Pseudoroseicyclus sp. CLL3-39]|uniref:Invasion associated locus B family protein n=2 Tax=Pseudoroseicyclus tamaricis TaxID=2705421 RepID=A0A6B2JSD5_9RHOB|nr:invasion associated locus B family protein [Pseudoroseicyclus tamaricis]
MALLGAALPAVAQDATGGASGDEAAATEDTAPAEGSTTNDTAEFDLGTPATEEPGPGDAYVRDEFDDWQLRCLVAEEGPDPCQLYQLLRNEDDTPVAEFTAVPLPEGSEAAAGAVVIVPLETQLTERLTVAIDGGQARQYEFDFCNMGGCVARFGLTTDQVNAFKAGSAATVSIVPAAAPDQRVNLNLSLAGFTAAFDYSEEDLADQ